MTKNTISQYIEIKKTYFKLVATNLWDFRYCSSNCSVLELRDVDRKSYILTFLRDLSSDEIENCFLSTHDLLEEFDISVKWMVAEEG